jgi:glycosyltransferase involved in cell wall biosynthesis
LPAHASSPTASIIVPCYNEVRTIGTLLDAITAQTVAPGELEVIVADGGSSDGTRQAIRSFAESHPELRLQIVDNPARTIPAALNTAIGQARGPVVIRLDAHSAPRPDYVQRCLETLQRTQAANVGGSWDIQPGAETWVGRAIAAATAHPLGAGDARYRIHGAEGPADTVPFGAFDRRWLDKVGRFNEALLTNEDYEYNVRIRKAGGIVWFDPAIRSSYVARPTLRGLARQYARYGFWKARMLLQFPSSLRWRQALPPLFVLASAALAAGATFSAPAGAALALGWAAYVATLLVSGTVEGIRRRRPDLLLSFPPAIATIHLAWGGAFWAGLVSGMTGPRSRPRPSDGLGPG